jgi:uncharacterized membrane protein YbhN (UPF0104 family)
MAGLLSLLVVVVAFGFALPRMSSYSAVWHGLGTMSWPWLGVTGIAVAASLVTTWLMIAAVLPSLRFGQAAVVNLGSSAVANTLPAGGAVAMGVSWRMLSGWGISTSQFVQYTLVSGLWNVLARLGLPVIALSVLAVSGHPGQVSLVAAGTGAALLVAALAGLRALVRSERFAGRADRALARLLAMACRLARRPRPRADGLLLQFRAEVAGLVTRRGLRITLATVASQVTLWLVLLGCLRASGLAQHQVPWQVSLAAFAFARLLSVLPVTPGGVGVMEVGLAGPLIAGLHPAEVARVTAAVLLFRAVTYLLPIPFGGVAYVWWRRTRHPRTRPVSGTIVGKATIAG